MDKNNTLNVLRLISAVFVIIYHSCPLTGNFSSLFGILAGIGIGTFFIISGYFIIQSWFSDPTPSRFLWKRLLRLVPELAAMVIFPIFFIGPINTRLPLKEYFFDIHVWLYFGVILVLTHYLDKGKQSMTNQLKAVVKIDKSNTLDVLRLISAVIVRFHHSYGLTRNSEGLFDISGRIAVGTFFTISGYVIAQSWFSDPTPYYAGTQPSLMKTQKSIIL
jgi:peptidoglycan/LPS O-acetylase OafA/YrhL